MVYTQKILELFSNFANNLKKENNKYFYTYYCEDQNSEENNTYNNGWEVSTLCDVNAEYDRYATNNPHDKIIRKEIDEKKNAIKIINTALEGKVIIKEEDIEKYNSSFITQELRNSEADIVYKIKGRNIFFLIEHQSKIDYTMAYRVVIYQMLIMQSVMRDENGKNKNKNYLYPQIIPIVLYTGNRIWNAKLALEEMQENLANTTLSNLSKYTVIDVNKISKEELLEDDTTITKIMLMEKSKTEEEFIENWEKVEEIFKQDAEKYTEEEKTSFRIGIVAIAKSQYKGLEIQEEIQKYINEGGDSMLQIYETLRKDREKLVKDSIKKGIEQGRAEGKLEGMIIGKEQGKMLGEREGIVKGMKEGRKEGRRENQLVIIKNMLKDKLSIELICKYTGLTSDEVEEIANS